MGAWPVAREKPRELKMVSNQSGPLQYAVNEDRNVLYGNHDINMHKLFM
jgi:hypothetical protein